mmetsp:Transcript_72139/g.169048  ORF Transcript_72139/g.169048 Transcript_72139/m.169048 type:complete len:200 (-) Transcript_72139:202-801(-)
MKLHSFNDSLVDLCHCIWRGPHCLERFHVIARLVCRIVHADTMVVRDALLEASAEGLGDLLQIGEVVDKSFPLLITRIVPSIHPAVDVVQGIHLVPDGQAAPIREPERLLIFHGRQQQFVVHLKVIGEPPHTFLAPGHCTQAAPFTHGAEDAPAVLSFMLGHDLLHRCSFIQLVARHADSMLRVYDCRVGGSSRVRAPA